MEQRTLAQPLLEEDYQRLKKELETTNEVEQALNRAQRAGVNIGDGLKQNADNRKRLQSLLNTYFPGR